MCHVCCCYIVKVTRISEEILFEYLNTMSNLAKMLRCHLWAHTVFDRCLHFPTLVSLTNVDENISHYTSQNSILPRLEPWVGMVRRACQNQTNAFWGDSLTIWNYKAVFWSVLFLLVNYASSLNQHSVWWTDDSKLAASTCRQLLFVLSPSTLSSESWP